MIFEVFKDLYSFLFVMIITMAGFTHIFLLLGQSKEGNSNLVLQVKTMYNLAYGELGDYGDASYESNWT
jgi:hypothetical protein